MSPMRNRTGAAYRGLTPEEVAESREKNGANLLEKPPRDPKAFIVTRRMAVNIFGAAAFFLAIFIVLLLKLDTAAGGAGLSVFFMIFVMLQFWNLFNVKCAGGCRSIVFRLFDNPTFLAIAAVILTAQIAIVQFDGGVFRTVPLSWRQHLAIIAATSVVLWAGELARLLRKLRR